jgi:antitoxin ParD1/3/4
MKQQAMRALTISLSPKQVGRVEAAVESGAYASNSEVMRDALRLWEEREEKRGAVLAALKRAYDEGLASGVAKPATAASLLKEFRKGKPARG